MVENRPPLSFGEALQKLRRDPQLIAKMLVAMIVVLGVLYVTSYERFHEIIERRMEDRRAAREL
jgi:hypothetical protein